MYIRIPAPLFFAACFALGYALRKLASYHLSK